MFSFLCIYVQNHKIVLILIAAKDYGLFLAGEEGSGVWLESGRSLSYYLLRSQVCQQEFTYIFIFYLIIYICIYIFSLLCNISRYFYNNTFIQVHTRWYCLSILKTTFFREYRYTIYLLLHEIYINYVAIDTPPAGYGWV